LPSHNNEKARHSHYLLNLNSFHTRLIAQHEWQCTSTATSSELGVINLYSDENANNKTVRKIYFQNIKIQITVD